jgi:hypothetical protein
MQEPSHLGSYFWKRFCEEVRRPHAGFHRAKRMFDRLAPLPHSQRIVVNAPLHFFQRMPCSQRVIRRSLPVVRLALSAKPRHALVQ